MARRKIGPTRPAAEDLLDRQEAADYLGVATQTLAIWKTTGRYSLPVVKVGRLARYRRSDLENFLCRRTVDSGSASDDKDEFAEVKIVEPRISESTTPEAGGALEVVLPSGITLRLGAGCSLDLLSSVMTVLEKH